jgi:hypothetical protein
VPKLSGSSLMEIPMTSQGRPGGGLPDGVDKRTA